MASRPSKISILMEKYADDLRDWVVGRVRDQNNGAGIPTSPVGKLLMLEPGVRKFDLTCGYPR